MFKPMLAHEYEKHKGKVVFPCCVQPKLDGLRCIAVKDEYGVRLWTRSGKPIETVPHIAEQLAAVMCDGDVLDGELYNHHVLFEKINGDIRRVKFKTDTSYIQYHIYDFPSLNLPFSARSVKLREMVQHIRLAPDLYWVHTHYDVGESELEILLDTHIYDGYEGIMIRNPNSMYENKRSFNLLKLKKFDEDEFEIVGWKEGKGKLKGHVGAWKCITDNGDEFDAKLDGAQDNLRRLFENNPDQYIGKQLTVKYQGFTKNGIPRFPVAKAERWDK